MIDFQKELIHQAERAGFAWGIAAGDHRRARRSGSDERTVEILDRITKAREHYARTLSAAAQAALATSRADMLLIDLNERERRSEEGEDDRITSDY